MMAINSSLLEVSTIIFIFFVHWAVIPLSKMLPGPLRQIRRSGYGSDIRCCFIGKMVMRHSPLAILLFLQSIDTSKTRSNIIEDLHSKKRCERYSRNAGLNLMSDSLNNKPTILSPLRGFGKRSHSFPGAGAPGYFIASLRDCPAMGAHYHNIPSKTKTYLQRKG